MGRLRKAAGTEFDPPTQGSAPTTNAVLPGDANAANNSGIQATANTQNDVLAYWSSFRTPETIVREKEIQSFPLVVCG